MDFDLSFFFVLDILSVPRPVPRASCRRRRRVRFNFYFIDSGVAVARRSVVRFIEVSSYRNPTVCERHVSEESGPGVGGRVGRG